MKTIGLLAASLIAASFPLISTHSAASPAEAGHGPVTSATFKASQASPKTYYLPAPMESTSNRTSKVNVPALRPGDTLALQRGAVYTDAFRIDSSGTKTAPISVTSYGSGAAPRLTRGCMEVRGNYVSVKNIVIKTCPDVGISIYGNHVRVSNVRISKARAGIEVWGNQTIIERSRFTHNDRMGVNTPGGTDDYGATGINIFGTNTLVRNNFFAHNVAKSYDFGLDGGSVEIFEGSSARIVNNVAEEEIVFSELGGVNKKSRNILYRNNVLTSSLPNASFVVARGKGDYFGPTYNTVLNNNRAYLRGSKSIGVYCSPNCDSSILKAVGNRFTGEGAAWIKDSYGGGNNVWCGEWTDGVRKRHGDRFKTLNVGQSYSALKKLCR